MSDKKNEVKTEKPMTAEEKDSKLKAKLTRFIWNTPIQSRTISIVGATDRPTITGVIKATPGRRIEIKNGMHETADEEIIAFLKGKEKSYNQDGPDGFRLMTEQEKSLIDQMRAKGNTREGALVLRLREAMTAMSI